MRSAIFVIVIFFHFNLSAQQTDYTFRHIEQTDGLLHTEVQSIVQDVKGYMWILTRNGLQRYDGYRFVNYPYDLNNPNYLTDTRQVRLFADNKNQCLWLMNWEIEKFDLQKNSFRLYKYREILSDSNFKFDQYRNENNQPFLLGDFGLAAFNEKENKMLPVYMEAHLLAPNKNTVLLTDSASGQTWQCDWRGLQLFDKKTHKIYTHRYNPIQDPLLTLMDKDQLGDIIKDSKGNTWIGSGDVFFYRYNSTTQKLSTYSLADITQPAANNASEKGVLIVKCFFEDNHHTLWIGTSNGGLLRYDREQDRFISIINQENNKQGLHYNYDILCIFQDKEENIWLGTDKGISIFNPYRQYFQSIHHEENNAASIPKREILNFIQAPNGNILVGTWGGGITVYDSNWNFKKTISFTAPVEYNRVWSFVQQDDGTVWAGCQHGFIHVYDPADESIKTIHPPELHNLTIWSMAKDKKGNIWMGLHDGKLAEWNKAEQRFYAYNDSAKGIEQAYMPAAAIFFDSKQRCWVSTEAGLKEFDTRQRMYTAVYTKSNLPNSISSNAIEAVEEYNDSTLLIGTVHGGLNYFNPRTKTFRHFTVKDGLPANNIHALKKDTDGYMWFTTDYDLYKFKPTDNKMIRLNIEPGTINTEFNAHAFYILKDGRWLTATTTELICFNNRNDTAEKNITPKVEITGFRIFDTSFFIDSLLQNGQPVRLAYDQNFLTIEFSSLNFSNRQQTKYACRLSGVDKDWVSIDTKNFASYTNLNPGKYIFSVKTENEKEGSKETSFVIIIAPPFWKTWWFITLMLLITAWLVFKFIRWRENNIKAVEAEKLKVVSINEKLAAAKLEALRSQMNPHFIFNCLNSIDNLIQNNEKEKATLYLAKFAGLIRSILETSKNDVIPCWKDMETLKLYLELEQLRWDKKISYEIVIGDEILQGDYKVPPLIIQPFVENAIYHGLLNKIAADKKLFISVHASDNHIHYIIKDNGVGRVKAATYKALNKPAHQSMGMQITTDRINLFNQHKNGSIKITDLVNEQEEGIGTKVEVTLINQP